MACRPCTPWLAHWCRSSTTRGSSPPSQPTAARARAVAGAGTALRGAVWAPTRGRCAPRPPKRCREWRAGWRRTLRWTRASFCCTSTPLPSPSCFLVSGGAGKKSTPPARLPLLLPLLLPKMPAPQAKPKKATATAVTRAAVTIATTTTATTTKKPPAKSWCGTQKERSSLTTTTTTTTVTTTTATVRKRRGSTGKRRQSVEKEKEAPRWCRRRLPS
mmetsp:Transcript_21049/g.38160  ORF Transcript_21049/g.38160 Transcript_21049/m.38160 type:complete len:217 (+) Transcript_21049:636-1286(+)